MNTTKTELPQILMIPQYTTSRHTLVSLLVHILQQKQHPLFTHRLYTYLLYLFLEGKLGNMPINCHIEGVFFIIYRYMKKKFLQLIFYLQHYGIISKMNFKTSLHTLAQVIFIETEIQLKKNLTVFFYSNKQIDEFCNYLLTDL